MIISYLKLFLLFLFVIFCSVFALIFSLIDRSFTLYRFLEKFFSSTVLFISGIKLKVTGTENLDKDAVYIYVSNHSSQFDIPILQYSTPTQISIVYKKELAKIPLFGWQLRVGPTIMIDRQNAEKALKSIERAKERMIKKRLSPLLFAEGTRSRTGEVQPFKRGAFYLAARAGFPVVPVSISGSFRLLPKGKFRIKSGTVYVHFSEPVTTQNLKSRKDELELMEKVRDIVIKNLKKD